MENANISTDAAGTDTIDASPIPSETSPNANRSTTPSSEGFKAYIGSGWAERTDALPAAREQAAFAAARRATLSARFTGQRLIVPAGSRTIETNSIVRVLRLP